MSNQGHDEIIQVVDQWLAAKMDIPSDQLAIARMAAEMYARFLAERVNVPSVNPPPWVALDLAWREWRDRARRDHA